MLSLFCAGVGSHSFIYGEVHQVAEIAENSTSL